MSGTGTQSYNLKVSDKAKALGMSINDYIDYLARRHDKAVALIDLLGIPRKMDGVILIEDIYDYLVDDEKLAKLISAMKAKTLW